jgi:uncharacterized membrane protein
MITSLLTLFIVGLVSIIALGIILSLLGAMVGLAFFLLFKVAPILLVGYLVIRFLSPKKKSLSAEDEEWLQT